MEIVFFVHPGFQKSQSMPRFAKMLAEGMVERGHNITTWTPKRRFINFAFHEKLTKWMGYIDQYILFPREIKKRLKTWPAHTLFVFTDHALGPWVPLVAHYPHVIHCHDFLAQKSGLGQIQENIVKFTGRKYQRYIWKGYTKGKNFISVSQKTKEDLEKFLPFDPDLSEVVYNGLNQCFAPANREEAKTFLSKETDVALSDGFILHVGGNQWYKNRPGIIEIYNAWRKLTNKALPLVLIGPPPSAGLVAVHSESAFKADIHFLNAASDDFVRQAYVAASLFLFPSLAEGFGWPIAEAMASGCPVITTNEAPMTEVAGTAAFLIERRPAAVNGLKLWVENSAKVVEQVLSLTPEERNLTEQAGIANAARFNTGKALNRIESLYAGVLKNFKT